MAIPTITNQAPVGGGKKPDAVISFSCNDDVQVNQSTIKLTLTKPDTSIVTPISAGVFDVGNGWDGTITANGSNGYDILFTSQPLHIIGTWQAEASCKDNVGDKATLNWNFTVKSTTTELSNQNPIGVQTIEPDEYYCRLTDDWGIDLTSIDYYLIDALGGRIDAIVSGVAGIGVNAIIVGKDSNKIVDIWIKDTKGALENNMKYQVFVEGENVVGQGF